MSRTLPILIIVLASALWPAAGLAERTPSARATWTATPPRIDGRLDDPGWRNAPAHSGFIERKPRLGAVPPVRTTFWILFDDDALYVGVECADDRPDLIRARTRSRDSWAVFRDDAISVKIDPAHDHRTTLGFVLGPAGARLDYRGIDETQWRIEFDAAWRGAAARTRGGWSAEFSIPFAALGIDPRNRAALAQIGFNLTRDHSRRNASYDWSLMPPPFKAIAASRYGHLTGLDSWRGASSRGPRRAYAVIPYVLGGFVRERIGGQEELDGSGRFTGGIDARAELGSGWRAQVTVNTDFAHVDLDDQVVNLTRFGLFLPEKRDFFLRDLEVFSFGEEGEAQLLHTRRIGLRRGTAVPVLGGLKLVGRAGSRVRVGLLQVTTRPDHPMIGREQLPWTSHLVGRALLELGGGSNVGLMLTHRQSLERERDHNLVLGADGALRAASNRLLLQANAMVAMTGADAGEPEEAAGGVGIFGGADQPSPAATVALSWRGLLLRPRLAYAYRHPDFRADLGFFKRVGVHVGTASVAVEPRIERFGLEHLTIEGFSDLISTAQGLSLLDWTTGGRATLTWEAGFRLGLTAQRRFETVVSPFTVGRDTTIASGEFAMNQLVISGETPSTLPAGLTGGLSIGDYYGGTLTSVTATVTVRPTALLRYEVGGEHSQARFDDARRSFSTSVLNARIGLGFTRNLGLDTFVAWNSLADLVSLQGRLRWTYSHDSDIFVVFQQDLDDGTGRTHFQSLLVKATLRWP